VSPEGAAFSYALLRLGLLLSLLLAGGQGLLQLLAVCAPACPDVQQH
jgi:hypothetical protein